MPKNHFALADEAKQHLLLAGGIGVTPILCMAERLALLGSDFEMHYAARSVQRMAFVERIQSAAFAEKVHLHFDDGIAEQKLNLKALLGAPAPHQHLYVCGPKGFMDAVLDMARSSGWSESQLYWEFFAADATPRTGDEAFEVQIASSGQVVNVPADKTVVQALSEVGVEIPVSCEQGVCGTCITRILAGQPEHRDVYLTPDECAANNQFTPCCSRSKSARLVLDL